jgi:hypothetical protein
VSLWFRTPRLGEGERVLWEVAANRQQGSRAVGGKLAATSSSRLVFTPNRVESLLGGREWSLSYERIKGCDIADRTLRGGPFSGGVRRRLRLSLTDSTEELFVVNNAGQIVSTLSDLLGDHPSD